MKKILYSILLFALVSSCAVIAPYERQYISDNEMQIGYDFGQEFNNYIHAIREGSTSAVGAKTSGGCGCN